MRTISAVAEDIKAILNNIERTEECYGETLVDINEYVDEILSIDSHERKETEAATKLFNRIYRNDCFSQNEIKLFEKIEKALGFKLYFWQKTFLITGHFRQTGETTAKCLKRLLNDTPIDYSCHPKTLKEDCERWHMMKIKEQLQYAGIKTSPIFTCQKEVRDYKERVLNIKELSIDEMHPKFAYKTQEVEE